VEEQACWALLRGLAHTSRLARVHAGRLGLTKWQMEGSRSAQSSSTAVDRVCAAVHGMYIAADYNSQDV